MSEWIPDDDWATIVANVPIVSVDLLVRFEGGLVLGKRTNNPAKGYWFLPGGRVQKGETRSEAVHRIGNKELEVDVEIVEAIGAFEHFYENSEVSGVNTKHYLANGYVVDVVAGELRPDDQHAELSVFQSPPDPLHEHLRSYLKASTVLDDWL